MRVALALVACLTASSGCVISGFIALHAERSEADRSTSFADADLRDVETTFPMVPSTQVTVELGAHSSRVEHTAARRGDRWGNLDPWR